MFFLLSLLQAQAEQFGTVTSAISFNRIGLSLVGQHGIYVPKWEKEDSVLFQNTGFRFIGEVNTSPSFARVGGRVILNPIAVLKIQGYGFGDSYFGNFQTVVSYDDLSANYGTNSEIADYVESEKRQYSNTGWHAGGNVVLQAKVKISSYFPVFDYSHWNIEFQRETMVLDFEREKEVMLSYDGDQIFENNSLLLYQIDKDAERFMRIGSFTTLRKSIVADDTMLRTGLLWSMQTSKQKSHIVMLQAYLNDRSYTSLFPPYIAYAYKYTY